MINQSNRSTHSITPGQSINQPLGYTLNLPHFVGCRVRNSTSSLDNPPYYQRPKVNLHAKCSREKLKEKLLTNTGSAHRDISCTRPAHSEAEAGRAGPLTGWKKCQTARSTVSPRSYYTATCSRWTGSHPDVPVPVHWPWIPVAAERLAVAVVEVERIVLAADIAAAGAVGIAVVVDTFVAAAAAAVVVEDRIAAAGNGRSRVGRSWWRWRKTGKMMVCLTLLGRSLIPSLSRRLFIHSLLSNKSENVFSVKFWKIWLKKTMKTTYFFTEKKRGRFHWTIQKARTPRH